MTGRHSCQLLIIDLLSKNFQEEQLKFRRFPVFREGISNSSRFLVFPGFLKVPDTLYNDKNSVMPAVRCGKKIPSYISTGVYRSKYKILQNRWQHYRRSRRAYRLGSWPGEGHHRGL